jgi:recombination protein RecT
MATEAAIPNANTPAEKDEGFRASFMRMESQFELALPPHMPPDRFMRVVLTAVNGNPDLLKADRASLFEAAMKAAQDGLLPDGREGALVIYNTKLPKVDGERDVWIKKVQWMPMIAGILKRVRNSGQLKTIVARVVYAGDKYRCWIDDDGEHVEFEAAEDHDTNIVRRIFAMAKLKDDSVEVEELFPADVEKMREASKSKGGPAWANWWSEMAKKGALRRLSKRLPISADLDDLIRRDDELYDFSSGKAPALGEPVKNPLRDSAHAKLDKPGQTIDATANRDEPEGEAEARAESMEAIKRGEHGPRGDDASQALGKPAEGPSDDQAAKSGPTQNNAQPATSAKVERPYTDAASYIDHMRDEFDKATSEAFVSDLWGSTRRDRQELLTDLEQLGELEKDKKATIAKLKLRKGGA